jgi:hypothetical protein
MPLVRALPRVALTLALGACANGRVDPTQAPGARAPPGDAALDVGARDLAAERGAAFAQARGCAACHQSDEPSDGVLSGRTVPLAGTRVFAPNLTPDVVTGLGAWQKEAIVDAIRLGVDDGGRRLCAPMPRFLDMRDAEASAIVAYLRALSPVHREIPESTCPEDASGRDASPDVAPADAPAVSDGPDDVRCRAPPC